MRKILVGVLACVSCSISEMKPVDPDWDSRTDPRCDTNQVYAVGDAAGAVLSAGAGVAIAVAGKGDGIVEGVGLMGVIAAVLTISAVEGFHWDTACKNAQRSWDELQIEQDQHLRGNQRRDTEAQPVRAPIVAPPRGFYCVTSVSTPAAGFCMRGKVACVTAHDAVASAIADITDCTLVESAWCFDEGRCAPTRAVCVEQRQKRVGTDGEARDCAEAR